MQNFALTVTVLDFGMDLNFDIFETGIINLIITIILVGLYLKENLPGDLNRRKDIIIKKIEDGEIKLKEAQQRLNVARKQFNQIDIIVSYIRNESINTKKKLLNSDLSDAEKDLTIQFERAFNAYFSKERIVFLEIKKKVILIVLNQLIESSKQTFSRKDLATNFTSTIINNLELKGEWI